MRLDIPYGDGIEVLDLEDRFAAQVVRPNPVSAGDEREIITRAIRDPLNSPPIGDFLADKRRILFVINDATRPTPTKAVLDILLPMLAGKMSRFLVATGSHPGPTEEEYRVIFGPMAGLLMDRIHVHDSKRSSCFSLGKTRHGNEIRLNRLLLEADAVIPIGSVEPHYFAGYTGGRKSFMPGVAAHESITTNHKLALLPAAGSTILGGNPVAEELEDAEALLMERLLVFSVMTVLDSAHRTYAAAAGDLRETFRYLIRKTDEVYVVPVETRADIVVAVAQAPTDATFYQAQKAAEHAKLALKEGGILILVAACRDGIGPPAFFDLLASGESCEAVVERMSGEYRLGYHKAGKLAEIGLKSRLWMVSLLEQELIRSCHIRPFKTVSDALARALEERGAGAKILFLMDGGHVVPRIRNERIY